jgi:hypothetical protein
MASAKRGVKFVDKIKFPKLAKVTLSAAEKALYKLATFIHKSATSSIRARKKPSQPGTPYSKGSGFLKKSIIVERSPAEGLARIGYFRGNKVADTHELGGVLGQRRKRRYPRRSALEPALEKGIADFEKKFPGDFQKYFRM